MNWKYFLLFYTITLVSSQIPTEEQGHRQTSSVVSKHENTNRRNVDIIKKGSYHKKFDKKKLIRKTRGVDPWGIFTTVFEVKRIHSEQKNETENVLRNIYNELTDVFSDTYTTTTQKTTSKNNGGNNDMGVNVTTTPATTTTQKYRVSRAELGRILRRNQLGLQRLLQLELNDAFNQSSISLAEYKEFERKQIQKAKNRLR